MSADFTNAMDCARGKFDPDTVVVSWRAHKGGNQWFVINSDNSISPTHSPKMRFGLVKEDEELKNGVSLGLVDEKETDKVLIFKETSPSVDTEMPSLKLEMTSPAAGKGIVWSGKVNQYGHGMDQLIKVSDNKDEFLQVWWDEELHVRDK